MNKSVLGILCLSLMSAAPTMVEAQSAEPILDEHGEEIIATFSIVARDPETEELGVAVQSRAFRAAAIVSYAKAGVGAVATQASANRSYGPRGLEMLEQGMSPEEVVRRLTEADEGRDRRQLAIIGADGRVEAYTGSGTSDWAGTSRARTTRRRATSSLGKRSCARWLAPSRRPRACWQSG